MNKKNTRKGFTIVELVIVIAVIAILATVLIPTFGNIIEKAENSKTLQTLRNEYTEYTIAVNGDIEDTIVIKLGDAYYSYENGSATFSEVTPSAGDSYWDGDQIAEVPTT